MIYRHETPNLSQAKSCDWSVEYTFEYGENECERQSVSGPLFDMLSLLERLQNSQGYRDIRLRPPSLSASLVSVCSTGSGSLKKSP